MEATTKLFCGSKRCHKSLDMSLQDASADGPVEVMHADVLVFREYSPMAP